MKVHIIVNFLYNVSVLHARHGPLPHSRVMPQAKDAQ